MICCCLKRILPDEFYSFDMWGQIFHPNCKTARNTCGCCFGIITPKAISLEVSPKFKICSNCKVESVLKLTHFQKCIKALINFYKKGRFKFPMHKIKFELIDFEHMPDNVRGQVTYSNIKERYNVQILRGLNKTILYGALSHELIHVFLIENQFNHFSHQDTEGLCELSSFFRI